MMRTIVTILAIMAVTTPIAYGQVEFNGLTPEEFARQDTAGTGPQEQNNQLSNQGLSQQEIIERDKFTLSVIDAVPTNNYRLCGGTVGETPVNFGCEVTLKGSQLNGVGDIQSAYEWPIVDLKKFKNTMIYGCVIGVEEKKVSCNVTGIPQTAGTEIVIDWSESSRMSVPATFSPVDEQPNEIVQRMASEQGQGQSPTQTVSNNNDNEEEEEDED